MLLELIRAIHAERAQYMDRGIYVTVILDQAKDGSIGMSRSNALFT